MRNEDIALLWCCGCNGPAKARKSNGSEVYPHRKDLAKRVMWICDACTNYVGSHKADGMPLGSIPDAEIRGLRQDLHRRIDPLWQRGKYTRKEVYSLISREIGETYHTANVKSRDEYLAVVRVVSALFY